jgi:MFS family permease
MIGLALGFPIARWLAAWYGDYRVYGAALAVYAFFSFLCATADTIWRFVNVRLRSGLNDRREVLISGDALLDQQYALKSLEADHLFAMVDLIQALGGGYSNGGEVTLDLLLAMQVNRKTIRRRRNLLLLLVALVLSAADI